MGGSGGGIPLGCTGGTSRAVNMVSHNIRLWPILYLSFGEVCNLLEIRVTANNKFSKRDKVATLHIHTSLLRFLIFYKLDIKSVNCKAYFEK